MVRFVVMASGQASRMGEDKLALPWGDGTVLGHILCTISQSLLHVGKNAFRSSKALNDRDDPEYQENLKDDPEKNQEDNQKENLEDLFEVCVVARKTMADYGIVNEEMQEKDITASKVFKLTWITDPARRPLSETIRLGCADLSDTIQGICFVPGDQVGLEPLTLAQLTKCFLENRPDFLVPTSTSQDVSGSPVFFHRRYLEDLRSLQGEQGGKAVLNRYRELWRTYSVSAQFVEDVDTPQDYMRLKDR